jgi:uncharacterized protein (DUF1499 family)
VGDEIAMVRRRITDEPTSRLAVWARRFALFSLTATILAAIVVRADLLEIRPALATVGGAMSFAVLAIVLAFGAFIVIWKDGLGGTGYAISALLIGLMLMAYPGYLVSKGYSLPAISDITTDPIDPPPFVVVARLRTRDANPITYAGLYAAEQQRNAYPDVQPLTVQATPQSAFEAAVTVANKRKWHVVNARAPQDGGRNGYIEAIARTAIMGFRDDVAIRVRANEEGALVDVRSSSRYGRYDFGTNAARIRSFLADLEAAVEAQAPERNEKPEPKPEPKKGQSPRRAPARR